MIVSDDIIDKASVAVVSILENTKEFVTVYFLEKDTLKISDENIKKLNIIKNKYKNFSYEIITMKTREFERFKLSCAKYIPVDTYFRYYIPILKKDIDKAIYLDYDVIFLGDIKNLYEFDLEGNLYAAARNEKGHYMTPELMQIISKCRLKDPYAYFNNGVTIYNCKKCRENNITEKLVNLTLDKGIYLDYADQDICNIVFEDCNIELPVEFNTYQDRIDYNNLPQIIHYVGSRKPWTFNWQQADFFWKYAKKTPYYSSLKKELNKILFKKASDRFFSIKNIDEYTKRVNILGLKLNFKRSKIKYSKIKKSNFKIAFYVGCNDNRSSRYRVDNIVEGLTSKKIIADRYYVSSLDKLIKKTNYDIVVIFRSGQLDRENKDKVFQLIEKCKENKIPVVYDVDDWLVEMGDEITAQTSEEIIKKCSAITVTTDFLANLYSEINKNVYVIKNTINKKQFELSKELLGKEDNDTVRIVYQSGTMSHNRDFLECSDALLEIMDKYSNTEFHSIGHLICDDRFLGFGERFVEHPYMDYINLQKCVSECDINLAPLVINNFNNCKSELKIFESALLKIPTIASPIEPYSNIINNGHNGFIASNKEEWFKYLSELVENKNLRQQAGENAYNEIVPKFYIENEINNITAIYEKIRKDNK